jgi:uncharacterized protein YkwD
VFNKIKVLIAMIEILTTLLTSSAPHFVPKKIDTPIKKPNFAAMEKAEPPTEGPANDMIQDAESPTAPTNGAVTDNNTDHNDCQDNNSKNADDSNHNNVADVAPDNEEYVDDKSDTSQDHQDNDKPDHTEPSVPKPTDPPKDQETKPTEPIQKPNLDNAEQKPTEPIQNPTEPVTKPESDEEANDVVAPTKPNNENNAPNIDVVVPTEPTEQMCIEHDFELFDTTIDTSYELYDYVTDTYKCKNCNAQQSNVHAAKSDISNEDIQKAETTVINYVNDARRKSGLKELWTDSEWDAWANTRAKELAKQYSHRRPNGEDWTYAIDDYFTIGENIAFGQTSGINFYRAFYNSPQHRDTMMCPDAVGIAVGIYIDSNGTPYCAMIIIGAF